MHRAGQGMPRRTGDWKKQSFAPKEKTEAINPQQGSSQTSKEISMDAPLTGKEISEQMESVPNWTQQGLEIRRKFHFKDFLASIEFVNQVAKLAEAANHHPDITIQWNKVNLTLSTHSAKGLTRKDFELAKQVDTLPNS